MNYTEHTGEENTTHQIENEQGPKIIYGGV